MISIVNAQLIDMYEASELKYYGDVYYVTYGWDNSFDLGVYAQILPTSYVDILFNLKRIGKLEFVIL